MKITIRFEPENLTDLFILGQLEEIRDEKHHTGATIIHDDLLEKCHLTADGTGILEDYKNVLDC